MSVKFYVSLELVPLSVHLNTFPLLLKLNSQSPDTPCYMLLTSTFKVGRCFLLPLQSKSPVSFAKIPVQPPPQSFTCEQQQACFYPRRDRKGQRLNGIGEDCVCVCQCL